MLMLPATQPAGEWTAIFAARLDYLKPGPIPARPLPLAALAKRATPRLAIRSKKPHDTADQP
jgi:hypothetical protein